MPGAYLIALNLLERRVVVVGGGRVATRKVKAFLRAGAFVEVIAFDFCEDFRHLENRTNLKALQRPFVPQDLDGAFLVYAATDDPQINLAVWQACRQRRILVNVVDDIPHCDFFSPAVVQCGDVSIAVSTNGNSPALASWLRKQIEAIIPAQVDVWAHAFGQIRPTVKIRLQSVSQRAAFWKMVIDEKLALLPVEQGSQVVQNALEELLEQWIKDQAL